MRSKLHFFNVGVEREPHANSALAVIRVTARREDFVAIKVDVDNAPIELSVVRSIVDDPSLYEVIDELFFEYHFNFDGINFGWGGTDLGSDVDDALALMRALRERGIRAHFWV